MTRLRALSFLVLLLAAGLLTACEEAVSPFLESDRYFVLIMMDEPKGTKETFGFATGGWTAAPAVGRAIDRIGPVLGVARVADLAEPDLAAAGKLAGAER